MHDAGFETWASKVHRVSFKCKLCKYWEDENTISLENVKDIIHPLGVYVLYSGNIPHYFNTSELNTWINTNQTNPLTREPISDQIKNRINKNNPRN